MRRRHGTGAYRRDLARLAIVAGAISAAPAAQAGGFDIPDLGTQAIGRGAAFVAKADDATAIHYNP
ncbi:hypothetical protein, partial [Staphylococcus aureus]|uniref:hypothetical protein n=1 Tax=Staphylococcus aureus TaxID=1280 RepID=UPI003A804BEE